MDRGTNLLKTLRQKLERNHRLRLEHQLAAEVLIREIAANGEFAVTIIFKRPAGVTFEKKFTRPYVFGSSFRMGPANWNVSKKVCDFATETLREALEARKAAM